MAKIFSTTSSSSSFKSNHNPLLLQPCCSIYNPKSTKKTILIPSSPKLMLLKNHTMMMMMMNNFASSQIESKRWKNTSRVVLGNDDDGSRRPRRRRGDEVMVKCRTAEGSQSGGAQPDTVVEKYRYTVVVLVGFVMCLCSADRTVMSVAIVPLAHAHAWSTSFVGIVQSSFLWGYIVSSVIGGAMADKLGGRRVMAWGAACWSLATLLTPWAADHSDTTLLVVRSMFGLAEGVAFPSMNILLSRWFPEHERARAVGFSMAGFQLGNVLGLCVSPVLMSLVGIQGPFVLFSSLGILWLVSWVYGVTNDPKQSPFVGKAEIRAIQAGKAVSRRSDGKFKALPISTLLPKMPFWAIVFANFTNNWGYFVLLSWMPIYFNTVLHVNLRDAAWFSAIPWGMMAVSSFIAGTASDYFTKAGHSLISVRKCMQTIGFVGPGLALLCLNYAKTPEVASIILTIALSLSSFSQAGYFLNIQDIAPHSSGLLHGISNAVGTLAAIISTIGAGFFVEWLGSFKAFLILTAMLYFATSIFYSIYATGERIV